MPLLARVGVSLCRVERRKILAPQQRLAKLPKNPVDCGHRGSIWRRNLDPDGAPAPAEVDQDTGRYLPRPITLLAGPPRQVIVGSKRSAPTERHFKIGLSQLSSFPLDRR